MKNLIILILILLAASLQAQDTISTPTGYTTNYKLRMWDEGAYPSADSVNQNLIDIDYQIKFRDKRIDSIKTAFSILHYYPSGILKPNAVTGSQISNGGVGALQINELVFRNDANRYFKKVYDDNAAFVGWALITDAGQFDDDTLKILPGVFGYIDSANNWTSEQYFTEIHIAGKIYIDDTVRYATSEFGQPTQSGLYVASGSGGSPTTELEYVELKINGVVRKLVMIR